MPTKESLQADLKEAMREVDTLRKNVIRLVLSAVKLKEVETGEPVDETTMLAILQKEVKSREETIEAAQQAGRPDMEAELEKEIAVLHAYLPQPLSADELEDLAAEVIEQVGATSPREMGQVMGELMPRLAGRADGRTASEVVRRLLSEQQVHNG
jgi:hypothetical protein